MSRLDRIEWTHPNLGEISETVCPSHEHGLLTALRALGIGCIGSLEKERDGCDRCRAGRKDPRRWLPGRVR